MDVKIAAIFRNQTAKGRPGRAFHDLIEYKFARKITADWQIMQLEFKSLTPWIRIKSLTALDFSPITLKLSDTTELTKEVICSSTIAVRAQDTASVCAAQALSGRPLAALRVYSSRGGLSCLDRIFHSLSGALRLFAYAVWDSAGRFST